MRKKWVRRSDVIILLMCISWFITLLWGVSITTVQVFRGDYNANVDGVMGYVSLTVGGTITAWLIKNMSEANTKSKLNPDYLKTHPPDAEDVQQPKDE